MTTDDLDLHGVRHADVEVLVEEHVLRHTPPFSIITGNSSTMKEIVERVLERHGFKYMQSVHNLGSITIL